MKRSEFWYLVRPMRVELIWIAPPPPQDGASTNFATAAKSFRSSGFRRTEGTYFSAEWHQIASPERYYFAYLFDLRQQIAFVPPYLKHR